MIICDHPRALFEHIPKTAGMSLVAALPEGSHKHPLCLPNAKHETVADFIARHGFDVFAAHTSFATVRDPLDRFLSRFAFTSTKQAKGADDEHLFRSLDTFIDAIEREDPLLMRRPERWRPQSDFITYKGRVAVNYLLRLERIEADFAIACARLGLPPRPLPRRNQSPPLGAPTPRAIAFVRLFYACDYDLLGYPLPN